MMQRSHGGAEYPEHFTFSKFKYKLQNLITEVRQLREKEQNTRRDLEILVQKQRNDESEQQKKFGALHAEIAAADKVRSNLENKVKDLQNEISIMANKQKESKGVIDSLLQSKDKLTNDLKASNYELKRDIDMKERELAILKGKLSRNLALLEAVEREVVCVKLAIDETHQILQGKEDKVLGLKQKLDKIMGYEKLFIEKIHLLENLMEEKQIEFSKKDTVIADLKDRLEYMMNDRKLQLQIEELQKLVEVKEDAIQNLILEKEVLLSQVQSLELVLSKFQDLQMETSPNRLLESQEVVDYALQKQIPKAEETLIRQNQEECKRDEKENNNSESERSELLPQIHDLTDNNIKYCDRGSPPYLRQEGDNLNQEQRDSSSTNEMQIRRSEKVCLGTRVGKSQCGQTFTLSKDSVELAASKNVSILQALQVNVRSSPIPEVTHAQTVRTHRNIAKSICCQVKANNIDSVFLKLDRSGFSSAASEKTDLYPYALDHCASSHSSSSSSSSLSTNGPASTLIGEVSSKTNLKEERLDSSYETATNITVENKNVTDAEYQNASKNAERKDNIMKGSKQVVDSVNQAAFEYATNGANVIEENKTVMDLAFWTPFLKGTSVMERREQALDLANHTALFDAKNKTGGLEETQQALDSAYQNGSNTENSTEESKEIMDSVDQIGVHNRINHGKFREENDQVFDSAYLTAFCNEAKRSRFMNHGIVPDSMQERVTSPLVCTHLTSLPALEVKMQCATEMDNSFTAEKKKFNCNFSGIETKITESSWYVQEDCDDNSPTSKVSPLPTKCTPKDPSYRDMVKCVKCEQLFYDTRLNLERKGLDEVRLTNFNYTCQNCKNEHGKKRRKLGFLTPVGI